VPVDFAVVDNVAQTIFPSGDPTQSKPKLPIPGFGHRRFLLLLQPVLIPLGCDPLAQLLVSLHFVECLQCPCFFASRQARSNGLPRRRHGCPILFNQMPGYGRSDMRSLSFQVQPVLLPLGSDPNSKLCVFSCKHCSPDLRGSRQAHSNVLPRCAP
jgi:hypothetical protein